MKETLAQYKGAALVLYEKSGKEIPPEEYVSKFMSNIEAQIPAAWSVEISFQYDEDIYYVPLPTDVEEELMRAEIKRSEVAIQHAQTSAELQRISAETEMRKDALQSVMRSKQEKVDTMLDTIGKELKATIFTKLKDALESLRGKKKLSGSTAKSLKNIVEHARLMNFTEDLDVEQSLVKLETMLKSKAAMQDKRVMTEIMHSIATEFSTAVDKANRDLPMIRDYNFLI